MLGIYSNQTVSWKQKTGANDANEATYTTSNIKGRFSYKRRLMRTATGEQIMSDAIFHTKTVIVEGDVLVNDNKDWKIRFVKDWIDIDGKKIGYRAVL